MSTTTSSTQGEIRPFGKIYWYLLDPNWSLCQLCNNPLLINPLLNKAANRALVILKCCFRTFIRRHTIQEMATGAAGSTYIIPPLIQGTVVHEECLRDAASFKFHERCPFCDTTLINAYKFTNREFCHEKPENPQSLFF